MSAFLSFFAFLSFPVFFSSEKPGSSNSLIYRMLVNGYPANKLRYNYVFFVIFWLQTNVTKKWPFYNVISVRNSNVPKYNLILTSLKNVTTSNKQIT